MPNKANKSSVFNRYVCRHVEPSGWRSRYYKFLPGKQATILRSPRPLSELIKDLTWSEQNTNIVGNGKTRAIANR